MLLSYDIQMAADCSLLQDLGLRFGQAFKFSRHWFNKYHKQAG